MACGFMCSWPTSSKQYSAGSMKRVDCHEKGELLLLVKEKYAYRELQELTVQCMTQYVRYRRASVQITHAATQRRRPWALWPRQDIDR